MARSKRWKGEKLEGGFVALPWAVLDSPKYKSLRYPARALLLELARQYRGDNNGRLLASKGYLAARGWSSNDVINRAKQELLKAGFIHETVKGHRPNKASWYALTWFPLNDDKAFDLGAYALFRRGAYAGATLILVPPSPKPTHEELFARHSDVGRAA